MTVSDGGRTTATTETSEFLDTGESVLLGDLNRSGGDRLPGRDEVEPYLAALLQAEHLNLLVGAGLTMGLAHLAGFHDGPDMTASLAMDESELGAAIESRAKASAERSGRGAPNLEDRLRVALSVAEGLGHINDNRTPEIQAAIDEALKRLSASVVATEAALARSVDDPVAGSMSLRGVLMTFLGSFAGRAPTRDRLHVFTTNYDRVIEWGAELAGLRVVDRFVGSLEPVFRSSRLEVDYHYSPPGTVRDPRHLDGVLRLTKLHGSLDWRWDARSRRVVRTALPFGSTPAIGPPEMLVYPNAAKDVETTFHPYADLSRDYSAALCRPHTALVTYGYSFGDDHLNRVIKDMLTIPSTHLLIISFDDKTGRIAKFAEDHRRLGQISLMIGPAMASLDSLVGRWLPWPSAEFLLQRRAQIYRDRSPGPGAPVDATGGSTAGSAAQESNGPEP